MSRTSDADPDSAREDAFQRQVIAALEHCTDPRWLGEQSPLSAPYLLGGRLDAQHKPTPPTAEERGAALLVAMQEAATTIEDAELRAIIENRYLNRNRYLSNTGLALKSGVSERTFYRLRNRAIQVFSIALYNLLVPPLRLERPDAPLLSGRRYVATTLRNFLEEGRSVYLSGESGIGKSTLAASVMRGFAGVRDLFWFTVRPGFNDHFTSFVFSLAFFLHEHGAHNTWRQIIAESGRLREERTLALLRHDCAALEQSVLICVDEVDQLRVEIAEHGQLFGLLEALQLIAPDRITLLLVGQRIVQRTPVQIPLAGFSEEEVRQWTRDVNLGAVGDDEIVQLASVTRGSPLLLTLFAALVRAGESIDSLLLRFGASPPLESLMMRIWQRLNEPERILLMRLSAFDVAAPADAYRDNEETILALAERSLLRHTSNDLLVVSPHLRPLIYSLIPAELQRQFHADASRILEERGNITGAMRQAAKAREETRALLLWLRNRDDQVARGQASTALGILNTIASTDLASPALGPILQMARSDLEILLGNAESANRILRALPAFADRTADAYKTYLLARSYEQIGDTARADALLQMALEAMTPPVPITRSIVLTSRGYLRLMRMRDLSQGRRIAARARIEAETLRGWVEEASGNLVLARTCFENALAVADEVDVETRVRAYVYLNLGRVLMNLNHVPEGLEYMLHAVFEYESMGDLTNALSIRVNIAYAHTISGDPEEGLNIATVGLGSALRMKESMLIAGLAAAAGEAAVFTGDWEDAERYLDLSLQQEEEFHRAWALTALGVLRAKQKRHADAVRLLEAAAQEANRIEDPHGEAYALHPLAVSQHALGDVEAAYTSIVRAHELYTGLGMARETAATAELLNELAQTKRVDLSVDP